MCIEVMCSNTFSVLYSTLHYPERQVERQVWSPGGGDLCGFLGTGFIPELEVEAAGRPPTLRGLEGSSALSCMPAFTTQTASPNRRPLSVSPRAWVPLDYAVVLPGKGRVIHEITHFMDLLTLRSSLCPSILSTSWAPSPPIPHLLFSFSLGRRCRDLLFPAWKTVRLERQNE